MFNYKLTVEYDGTQYAGWQIQRENKTIQGEIVNAIQQVLQEEVNLIGSGRTDAGVHALGQVANFRSSQELDTHKFCHSLNSLIPDDISIKSVELAHEGFHSRFEAKKRSYLYLISHFKSPFYHKYSYYYSPAVNMDFEALNRLSKVLLGEHDFTSFCRTKTEIDNKICSVNYVHWRSSKSFTIFYIEANRFLHGMVKTAVGTLLHAEKNKLGEEYIRSVLNKKDRCEAGEAVPSKGLFLFKVRY